MHTSFEFTYLIRALFYILLWIPIYFFCEKSLKKQMIIASLVGSVLGVISEYWFTIDWWNPITITGTRIGIEDLLFGFGYTGILAVLGKLLCGKTNNMQEMHFEIKKLLIPISLGFSCFVFCFYLFGSNSLYAMLTSLTVLFTYLISRNERLWELAILGCFGILILAIIENNLISFLYPGWIEAFYTFDHVPKLLILGITIDDFLFYGLTALVGSIIFESVYKLELKRR